MSNGDRLRTLNFEEDLAAVEEPGEKPAKGCIEERKGERGILRLGDVIEGEGLEEFFYADGAPPKGNLKTTEAVATNSEKGVGEDAIGSEDDGDKGPATTRASLRPGASNRRRTQAWRGRR